MTIPIRSLDDPRVVHYRHIADSRYLRQHGLFVAEGRLVVRRLLTSPAWTTESVLVTQTAFDILAPVFEPSSSPAPVYLVDQAAMNSIVGFNIHRGCLALAVRSRESVLTERQIDNAFRVLVLEGVSNPDNVGGLFRSAAAFGADLVVLGPDCGDPLYRKAVRTSMAATLAVPFVNAGRWPEAIGQLRASGFTVIALTPDAGAQPLAAVALTARIALLVGAEGNGLTEEALRLADLRVRIPMTQDVESLNVTIAASIAMYHAFGLADEVRSQKSEVRSQKSEVRSPT